MRGAEDAAEVLELRRVAAPEHVGIHGREIQRKKHGHDRDDCSDIVAVRALNLRHPAQYMSQRVGAGAERALPWSLSASGSRRLEAPGYVGRLNRESPAPAPTHGRCGCGRDACWRTRPTPAA